MFLWCTRNKPQIQHIQEASAITHFYLIKWLWDGEEEGGAETAWVNKDYVTEALMSFSSKQLLPPSFYLIKAFHLQQIQWHALVNRWKTSRLQESLVSLVILYPVCHRLSLCHTFWANPCFQSAYIRKSVINNKSWQHVIFFCVSRWEMSKFYWFSPCIRKRWVLSALPWLSQLFKPSNSYPIFIHWAVLPHVCEYFCITVTSWSVLI